VADGSVLLLWSGGGFSIQDSQVNFKAYSYVGPASIRQEAMATSVPGTPIRSTAELVSWLEAHTADRLADGSLTATFTISRTAELTLAPRRSEHVACAGGAEVLAAGEMTFSKNDAISAVSNLSTGYCPEPESWPAVAAALDPIGLPRPPDFTTKVIFRLCPSCNERNLVKDNWLVCALCDADLPAAWNFGHREESEDSPHSAKTISTRSHTCSTQDHENTRLGHTSRSIQRTRRAD